MQTKSLCTLTPSDLCFGADPLAFVLDVTELRWILNGLGSSPAVLHHNAMATPSHRDHVSHNLHNILQ